MTNTLTEKVCSAWRECQTFFGLPAQASTKDIRKAHRTLSLKWHPDKKGGSHEDMVKGNFCKEILLQPPKDCPLQDSPSSWNPPAQKSSGGGGAGGGGAGGGGAGGDGGGCGWTDTPPCPPHTPTPRNNRISLEIELPGYNMSLQESPDSTIEELRKKVLKYYRRAIDALPSSCTQYPCHGMQLLLLNMLGKVIAEKLNGHTLGSLGIRDGDILEGHVIAPNAFGGGSRKHRKRRRKRRKRRRRQTRKKTRRPRIGHNKKKRKSRRKTRHEYPGGTFPSQAREWCRRHRRKTKRRHKTKRRR